MPFKAHELYREYEPDKYKTSTQKKVEGVVKEAEQAGLGKKEVILAFKEAQELLGKDFLGPDVIEKTFGVQLTAEELQEVAELPFAHEELEQAKALGMMLVLRVDHDAEGKPLTINQIREMFKGGDTLGDPKKKKKKICYRDRGDGWYDKEEFATKATAKLGWGLVMKSVLPESTGKNWKDQEKVLEKWAKENGLDPKTIRRRTPVEVAYDTLAYYGANKDSLLENRWDWTNVQSSDGDLVLVGSFGSGGLRVGGVRPAGTGSLLGVVPAR